MPRRRKFENSNQLAFDFNAAVADNMRQEVTARLIPNSLVTPGRDASREDALGFFEKWQIPHKNQARMMGFWKEGPYEDWVNGTRKISDDESDRVSVLLQIDESLGEAFESQGEAMEWLQAPNKHFSNMSPLDYMSTRRSKVLLHVSMRLWLMKNGIDR